MTTDLRLTGNDLDLGSGSESVSILTDQVHRQADDLCRLTREVAQVEEQTRRKLARVLHDGLQQVLVAARMQIDMLRSRVDPAHLSDVISARDLIDESIQITRDLSVELNPPVMYEQSLTEALQWLGRQFADKHKLHVEVHGDTIDVSLPAEMRTLLFIAAQELLLNAAKHAGSPTARIHIRVSHDDQVIRMTVEDDGCGADPLRIDPFSLTPGQGSGLRNLRHRMALIGGKLDIHTAPGQGCRVDLEAPAQRFYQTLQMSS